MDDTPVLIVGGAGKTGLRVARRLAAAGRRVRPVSRSSTPAFDWNDPLTWPAVLEGVKSAYVTFYPDLALPGAAATIARFVETAARGGLEHMVLLSGRGEAGAQEAEAVLIDSPLAWNVVRASWFAQNFSESFMLQGVLDGELALPGGATAEPFIDVDDIAAVVVAALTEPRLRNRLFEVTGPAALTFAQCAELIGEYAGYPVRYKPLTVEAFIQQLGQLGQPPALQALMRELFSVVFDGRNSRTASGVDDALGRAPVDFESFVRKTAATGVWARTTRRVPAQQVAI